MKELPYFKFFIESWSNGDITLEDYETQGVFTNLCAYYWSKDCILTLDKAKKKFPAAPARCFDALIASKIIKTTGDAIRINFLDEQKAERKKRDETNLKNGKLGGRPKTQTKPMGYISETQTEPSDNPNITNIDKNKIREEKEKKRFTPDFFKGKKEMPFEVFESECQALKQDYKFLEQYMREFNLMQPGYIHLDFWCMIVEPFLIFVRKNFHEAGTPIMIDDTNHIRRAAIIHLKANKKK